MENFSEETYNTSYLLNCNEKCLGMILEKSFGNLMHNLDLDFTGTKSAIIGGRFNTDKLIILEGLIDQMNNIFLGGEIATTFNK